VVFFTLSVLFAAGISTTAITVWSSLLGLVIFAAGILTTAIKAWSSLVALVLLLLGIQHP